MYICMGGGRLWGRICFNRLCLMQQLGSFILQWEQSMVQTEKRKKTFSVPCWMWNYKISRCSWFVLLKSFIANNYLLLSSVKNV